MTMKNHSEAWMFSDWCSAVLSAVEQGSQWAPAGRFAPQARREPGVQHILLLPQHRAVAVPAQWNAKVCATAIALGAHLLHAKV